MRIDDGGWPFRHDVLAVVIWSSPGTGIGTGTGTHTAAKKNLKRDYVHEDKAIMNPSSGEMSLFHALPVRPS